MGDELRTLHAIGMTKGQMGRFLFAQMLLLTLAAQLTALLFAFTAGWGFTGWTLAWMPFGGLPIGIAIPWHPLTIGTLVLLATTFILTPLPIHLLLNRLLARR